MRRRPIALTFGLLTALFAAGYGVMFSVLDEFRDEYGISESALGAVVAGGFFASFGAQVLIAPLADRGRARLLLYAGLLCNVAGLIVMATGETFGVLLAGRLVMGVGAGSAIPAARRIVILAEPDRLGHNVGRLLAADVTGFALGPALSAVLVGPTGLATPFLVIAGATLACLPVVARVRVDESTGGTTRARFAFDLLRQRAYAGAVVMGAAVFLMIGTFDALWVLVLSDLGTSDWLANLGITVFALPLIFLGSIGGRMAQRVGPFRLGAVGLFLGAGFMFTYGQLPSGVAMTALAVVHSVSDGLTVSSTGVAVGMTAPAERQAGAQGLLGGVQTLTGGLTALMASGLYEGFGRAVAFTACGIGMVALTAGGALLAGRSWWSAPAAPTVEPALAASH